MGDSRGCRSRVWRPSVLRDGPSFSYRAQGFPSNEQPRTETFLSETTWVKWMDLGLKAQARIFPGRAGAGWPGVVRPPLFRRKGLGVLDVCPTLVTHVTSHLDTC